MASDAARVGETVSARQARAVSFGAAAGDYDRYRVGPPSDIIERLLPRGAQAALDLGAGTGAMSRQLAGRVAHLYAVDPDPRMSEVLARNCPEAEVLEGRAEDIPLPDASVDAVIVSSAWHWVDPAAAIPEIARVLRPAGTLGIVWNRRDRAVPWVAQLEAFRLEVTGGDDWVEGRIRHYLEESWLPPGSPFVQVEIEHLPWAAELTKGEIARLLTTFHGYISAPEERKPGMLRQFTEYVDADERIAVTGERPDGDALVGLPMVCHTWRATRQLQLDEAACTNESV